MALELTFANEGLMRRGSPLRTVNGAIFLLTLDWRRCSSREFQICGSTFPSALKMLGRCNIDASMTVFARVRQKSNFVFVPYGAPHVKTSLCHIQPC